MKKMNIVCSSKGIIDIKHPRQGINDLLICGFTDVILDLSMILSSNMNSRQSEDRYLIDPSLLRMYANNISSCFKEKNICNSIIYAPYTSCITFKDNINNIIEKLTSESIELCNSLNAEYIIVRPLANIAPNDIYNYYLRLGKIAKTNNTHILIENQCKSHNGHFIRGTFSDSEQTSEFIDKLNYEIGYDCFGICINFSALTLAGQNIYDYIIPLKNKIKAVILSDCDGAYETALLPFSAAHKRTSCTDWLGIIRGLRACNFDGTRILDIDDTISAFSPILHPNVLELAKNTVEYLKWQIELENLMRKYQSIVLFGAGNMCRNYMKCYGEKYPPLFTCDNNSKIWGTEFCGLEVKNPEELKNIPKDCAIFICNVYYREIEAQLREMGITNPIEYFNDEYLPRYEFNRIER